MKSATDIPMTRAIEAREVNAGMVFSTKILPLGHEYWSAAVTYDMHAQEKDTESNMSICGVFIRISIKCRQEIRTRIRQYLRGCAAYTLQPDP